MHIVIDYTPAVHQAAGIGRYTRGLVEALARLDRRNQFTLLVFGRASARFTPGGLPANFELRYVSLSDRWATILWRRLNLPLPVVVGGG